MKTKNNQFCDCCHLLKWHRNNYYGILPYPLCSTCSLFPFCMINVHSTFYYQIHCNSMLFVFAQPEDISIIFKHDLYHYYRLVHGLVILLKAVLNLISNCLSLSRSSQNCLDYEQATVVARYLASSRSFSKSFDAYLSQVKSCITQKHCGDKRWLLSPFVRSEMCYCTT